MLIGWPRLSSLPFPVAGTRHSVKLKVTGPVRCYGKSGFHEPIGYFDAFPFGNDVLFDTPLWHIDEQQLRVETETEHLGTVITSNLQAKRHVCQRMKRARGSFYGLTPAGILNTKLSPLDKAFLWRTIVAPSLTFGATAVPLRPEDISELERFQARHLKAALGLAPQTHHSVSLQHSEFPTYRRRRGGWLYVGFAMHSNRSRDDCPES